MVMGVFGRTYEFWRRLVEPGISPSLKEPRPCGPARFGAVLLVAGTGCGASMDSVFEGDMRFERCMALDVRPEASKDDRRGCWTEWLAGYSYGQTQDRTRHAQQRITQLNRPAIQQPDQASFVPVKESELDSPQNRICRGTCAAVHDDCRRSCPSSAAECHAACGTRLRSCEATCT
ncbi:MAG: hypothetical protein AAGA56_08485 [Myxococcota bacterium]